MNQYKSQKSFFERIKNTKETQKRIKYLGDLTKKQNNKNKSLSMYDKDNIELANEIKRRNKV